jgi:hypothetical protein
LPSTGRDSASKLPSLNKKAKALNRGLLIGVTMIWIWIKLAHILILGLPVLTIAVAGSISARRQYEAEIAYFASLTPPPPDEKYLENVCDTTSTGVTPEWGRGIEP